MTLPQKGEVPEIGSVWNRSTRAGNDMRIVVGLRQNFGGRGISVDFVTGTPSRDGVEERRAAMHHWRQWAKRAVRVDDKPRGQ